MSPLSLPQSRLAKNLPTIPSLPSAHSLPGRSVSVATRLVVFPAPFPSPIPSRRHRHALSCILRGQASICHVSLRDGCHVSSAATTSGPRRISRSAQPPTQCSSLRGAHHEASSFSPLRTYAVSPKGEVSQEGSERGGDVSLSPAVRDSTVEPGQPVQRPLSFPGDFLSSAGGTQATRRLVLSVAGACALAIGANFLGLTSALLGRNPEAARNLRLDVIYPINGFKRCLELSQGFEFIYPTAWLADQTLAYRAAVSGEQQRALDPLPLRPTGSRPFPAVGGGTGAQARPVEPLVAYGPPGGSGELNVSVIVADVDWGFKLDRFGDADAVGSRLLENVIAPQGSGLEASLVTASQRTVDGVLYYEIEFNVKGPSFRRHNRYVCCVYNSKLYSLNAQAPEDKWEEVDAEFTVSAKSFRVISA